MVSFNDVVVIIPHYSHTETLSLLIAELGGFFDIFVVNDGPNDLILKEAFVLKSDGVGFSQATNLGIAYAQSKGKKWVFVLNDDAFISKPSFENLLSNVQKVGIYSPVLITENKMCFGFKVSSWGRVKEIKNEFTKPKALCGAALLMPSWLRFNADFIHGMEDVELSLRIKDLGFYLEVKKDVFAFHKEGQTVSKDSYRAQKGASFGQMYLFPKYTFTVTILSIVQILKEQRNVRLRLSAVKEALVLFQNR
ncbi:MAG: hypothetical protein CMK59_11610 [Proteobacteria bacterium]|nr:hypothetical protein [Pseudomonadota bacterium]